METFVTFVKTNLIAIFSNTIFRRSRQIRLQDLTPKLQGKYSIILTLLNKVMTQNFSRNFKKTFGNLEQSLAAYKLGYLPFGTKKIKPKHWFLLTRVY